MITRVGNLQTLSCDCCGDPLDEEFEKDRFQPMIDHAKGEGWSIRQEDGSWRHFCPGCKGLPTDNKLDQQRKLFGR